MGRTQTADYSTGDLSQWDGILNVAAWAATGYTNGGQSPSVYGGYGQYPVTVVSNDADCGYVGRFEVRPGDFAGGSNNERSMVNASKVNLPNDPQWYAFSIKFDPTFPLNGGTDYGWGVTNQFQQDVIPSTPMIAWGFQVPTSANAYCVDGATPSGYWSLMYAKLQGNGSGVAATGLGTIRLLDVPMNRGQWIDVKMQIKWSTSDTDGFIKVWINGQPQTLRYSGMATSYPSAPALSPGATFTGRTVCPNAGQVNNYYCEGLYRQKSVGYPTGILYCANYRSASTEDGL